MTITSDLMGAIYNAPLIGTVDKSQDGMMSRAFYINHGRHPDTRMGGFCCLGGGGELAFFFSFSFFFFFLEMTSRQGREFDLSSRTSGTLRGLRLLIPEQRRKGQTYVKVSQCIYCAYAPRFDDSQSLHTGVRGGGGKEEEEDT